MAVWICLEIYYFINWDDKILRRKTDTTSQRKGLDVYTLLWFTVALSNGSNAYLFFYLTCIEQIFLSTYCVPKSVLDIWNMRKEFNRAFALKNPMSKRY